MNASLLKPALWLIAIAFAASSAAWGQSSDREKFVVEDGRDESWDEWAAYPPGYEKWKREYWEAFKKKDYAKAIALSDKMVNSGVRGVAMVYVYRGVAKHRLKQYDSARSDFATALSKAKAGRTTQDFLGLCYLRLASVAMDQNRMADTRDFLVRATRENPQDPEAYNALGWILATNPAAEIRNGRDAVRFATKACELTRWKSASCLDSLAAASAEAGDFAAAVKWQTRAIEVGKATKYNLGKADQRLALYRRQQPYRAPH